MKKQNNISQSEKKVKKDNNSRILTVKTANKWLEDASKKPNPKMLCGSLFYENELTFLFSDTNVGKSIFGVQMANGFSKGEKILGLPNEGGKKKVIYLDFELSDKQFELRCRDDSVLYEFDENLYRAQINLDFLCENSMRNFSKNVIEEIEFLVAKHGIEIVILDNLTYLGADLEKASQAISLMQRLLAIQKKMMISMIIIAHTPKMDKSKPITNNDMAGSKSLMNLIDSSFTIGKSSENSNYRYIKQLKLRNDKEEFGDENVVVCELLKINGLLSFSFVKMDYEFNHLSNYEGQNKIDHEFQNEIEAILEDEPNLSNREIAKKINSNHPKVGRHIKKMIEKGILKPRD